MLWASSNEPIFIAGLKKKQLEFSIDGEARGSEQVLGFEESMALMVQQISVKKMTSRLRYVSLYLASARSLNDELARRLHAIFGK